MEIILEQKLNKCLQHTPKRSKPRTKLITGAETKWHHNTPRARIKKTANPHATPPHPLLSISSVSQRDTKPFCTKAARKKQTTTNHPRMTTPALEPNAPPTPFGVSRNTLASNDSNQQQLRIRAISIHDVQKTIHIKPKSTPSNAQNLAPRVPKQTQSDPNTNRYRTDNEPDFATTGAPLTPSCYRSAAS
jgi:hypothetical protein